MKIVANQRLLPGDMVSLEALDDTLAAHVSADKHGRVRVWTQAAKGGPSVQMQLQPSQAEALADMLTAAALSSRRLLPTPKDERAAEMARDYWGIVTKEKAA